MKKVIAWCKNKNQRFREAVCAPIVFKIMDLVGFQRHLPYTCTGDEAQEMMYQKLMTGEPCLIGRIGATEIRNIEGTMHKNDSFFQKLKLRFTMHQTGVGKKFRKIWAAMIDNPDDAFFDRFTDLMLEDIKELDAFASWRWEESGVFRKPYPFEVISLWDLEPFFFEHPWTRALAGKRVLVIQPFTKAIESQYQYRAQLFRNPEILPEFELQTYMPFFRGLRDDPANKSWFENLDCMKEEISKLEFDIALIAAGPYGFSLGAHVKRMGKQAVIMGGVLQLLFGIRGSRWDGLQEYHPLFNPYWIYPGDESKPKNFSSFDGGCYWK